MKKIVKLIMVTLCFAVAVAFAMNANTNVSAKSKVTYKLKKGTLTIKGKGAMPKKMTFTKKKKKVKKVVIKKGVTSISNNAFKKCSKLAKATIPSTVKKIGAYAFYGTKLKTLKIPSKTTTLGKGFVDNIKSLDTLTMPGKFTLVSTKGNKISKIGFMDGTSPETVKFNTQFIVKNAGYFRTLNFTTYSKDTKYKSYGGVIYSKDGTKIVRVPSERDTLDIRKGCTVFNTSAVNYVYSSSEVPVCYDLQKIKIPASVVKVKDTTYPDIVGSNITRSMNLDLSETVLEIPELARLKYIFEISADSLLKKLPTRIVKKEDGSYVGDNEYLIQGDASKDIVEIKNPITYVCERAFEDTSIREVKLDPTVKTIDNYAFASTYLNAINLDDVTKLGAGTFERTSFTEITLPSSITSIPDRLFFSAESLKTVNLLGAVTSVGENAFTYTSIDLDDFLSNNTNIKTVGASAFYGVTWNSLTIPKNITTVGDKAFYENYNTSYCTIMGSTKDFSLYSFGTNVDTTLEFKGGISSAFTSPYHRYYKSGKKQKLEMSWDKVVNVSGYDIWLSKDKAQKKGVKKYTAKYNAKDATITLKTKNAKGLKYFAIRPYKNVNGKKTNGKWIIKSL